MHWLSKPWKNLLMVAPGVILFTMFIVYPVFYSLFYSFTNFQGFEQPELVGVKNYVTLSQDPIFWHALLNTATILVIAVVVLIPGSFLLAVLMNSRVRGLGILRALVFTPNIVAPILTGLIWIFILDPKIGLINAFLRKLHINLQPAWIGGQTLTPFSVSGVYIWAVVGFAMTIFYAGLQLVPADVMEASALDGASRWQQIRYVTAPMMRGTFAIVFVLVFTGALRIFEFVYQLTGGGPIHASEVIVSYMYYVTFTLQQYGLGMALAVIIMILGVIASVIYLFAIRERKQA